LQGFEQRGRGAGLALEALSIDGEAPEHHLPKGSAVLESDDLPLGYPLKGCEPRRPGAGGAVHRRRGARAPPAQGLRRAGERRPALEQGPQGAPLAPGPGAGARGQRHGIGLRERERGRARRCRRPPGARSARPPRARGPAANMLGSSRCWLPPAWRAHTGSVCACCMRLSVSALSLPAERRPRRRFGTNLQVSIAAREGQADGAAVWLYGAHIRMRGRRLQAMTERSHTASCSRRIRSLSHASDPPGAAVSPKWFLLLMHKADVIPLVAKVAEQSGVPVQPTCRVPPVAGARAEDGAPAGARVLVKTDGSASTGVTAGQGTLVTIAPREVDAEVATRPPKSHPRVAMWCGPAACGAPRSCSRVACVRCATRACHSARPPCSNVYQQRRCGNQQRCR